MCGLVGFLGGDAFHANGEQRSVLKRMSDTLVHRGPDDAGYWSDAEHGIALGHRRLAIIDLSPAGHQPMQSFSSRYVIAFNGEIYNHLDIR
jgi:asparagine synthase (glutamine-hydrolysing)